MNAKIAMPVHLPELQECTACHCFTDTGYMLRDSSMSRFICEECYDADLAVEYPLARKVVEIDKTALESIVQNGRKPGFHAGYLLGKKLSAGEGGYKLEVSAFLDSIQSGKGTACFFNKDDMLRIRKLSHEKSVSVVGIYRTNPSGSPEFNDLDRKTLADLLLDIVYMVVGGSSEIQVSVKDRSPDADEIGVVFR